jgi:hypothetical protein
MDPRRKKGTKSWKNLHKEELCNLYLQCDKISENEERDM